MVAQFTPPVSGPPASIVDVLSGAAGLGDLTGTAAANSDALFAGLLPLQWKDIEFPYSRIETDVRQDIAIHKFADRDGAHIEGTGRAPLQFTARIPMLNGLDAGPNEHWQRPLYPFVRDNLLRAAVDKSSGVLQHPELGPITCKLESMRWVLDAGVRSGVWVDVVWLESDDAGVDLEQDLANPSPLANAQAAANDLEFQLSTIDPSLIPHPYVPPIGFDDLMNAIRGVVDTPTLLQKQFAGRIDNFIYECNALESSLNGAANALNWPLIQASERGKEACYDLKASILSKGKAIGYWPVLKDSTLSQIAAAIPAPIGQVIQLNPGYMASPLVAAGGVVRYYLASAA